MLTPSQYLAEATEWLSGHQLFRPKYLVIESTNHCQLACEVCGATSPHSTRPRGMIDWNLFKHLVKQAALLRPERVCLHAFGEPLLHPRIVDMVALLTEQNLATELVTNGELLTPDLARRLRQAGLCELGISHPNVSSINYQLCRGRSAPPDIDARIAEAVKEWDGCERQLSIRCLTIKKKLAKGAPETAEFLGLWLSTPGVSAVVFHGYQPWPKHVCPDLIDFLAAKPRRCQLGMQSLSVLWDGTVTPCSFDVDGDINLGLAPKDSLVDLYNGLVLRKMRRHWMKKRPLPKLCKHCLVPRCATAAAWIGRQEWSERMALGDDQKLIWLGTTAKLTLENNKDIHGDRI